MMENISSMGCGTAIYKLDKGIKEKQWSRSRVLKVSQQNIWFDE